MMKAPYVLAFNMALLAMSSNGTAAISMQAPTERMATALAISTDTSQAHFPFKYSLPVLHGKVRLQLVDVSAPVGQRANIMVDLTDDEQRQFEIGTPPHIARPSGSILCIPDATRSSASGRCKIKIDNAFSAFLIEHGIETPNSNFLAGLIAKGVTQATVESLCQLMTNCPTIAQLTLVTGAGVDRAYALHWIGEPVSPGSYDELMMFKSLGVSPEYVHALTTAGISDLNSKNVIHLKMFGATPQKIESLASGGPISTEQVVSSLARARRAN